LIILILFGEDYKLGSSSLCRFIIVQYMYKVTLTSYIIGLSVTGLFTSSVSKLLSHVVQISTCFHHDGCVPLAPCRTFHLSRQIARSSPAMNRIVLHVRFQLDQLLFSSVAMGTSALQWRLVLSRLVS
jgi:hypothetical protein